MLLLTSVARIEKVKGRFRKAITHDSERLFTCLISYYVTPQPILYLKYRPKEKFLFLRPIYIKIRAAFCKDYTFRYS